MKFKSWLYAAALGVGLLAAGPSASAETIEMSFYRVSEKPTGLNDAATPQFRVSVSDVLGNTSQALFAFFNNGPIASSITDIYFDDGTPGALFQIARLNEMPGVDFEVGAKPGNLPGAKHADPDFEVSSALLSADSEPKSQPNGINPGETLGVLVDLLNGASFQTIKASLAGRDPLRVGIHVQGFGDGSSASYVSLPPTITPPPPPPTPPAVPLPATVWAGLALMGGIGAKRLRRSGVRA